MNEDESVKGEANWNGDELDDDDDVVEVEGLGLPPPFFDKNA